MIQKYNKSNCFSTITSLLDFPTDEKRSDRLLAVDYFYFYHSTQRLILMSTLNN